MRSTNTVVGPVTLLVLLAGTLGSPGPAAASSGAILWAKIFNDGEAHRGEASGKSGQRLLAWPFCPSYQDRCTSIAWVNMAVSLDVYSARRNEAHKSIQKIVDTSYDDLRPLAEALKKHFSEKGITSAARKAGYIQGLVQAVQYARDQTTGFTEYPKYAVEFFVDEQGDCDDAAVTASVLLRLLGFRAWFVLWRAADPRLKAGHISTAVSRSTGDLARVAVPAGSRFVVDPKGKTRLLHVDATGVIGGCQGRRCTILGWNKWHARTPPLAEKAVIRADRKDLDKSLNITAWNNDGKRFPKRKKRDRRPGAPKQKPDTPESKPDEPERGPEDDADRAKKDPRDQADRDWEDRTMRRLKWLGQDEAAARKLIRRQRLWDDTTWYIISAALAVGLIFFLVVAIKKGMAIRARVRQQKEERAGRQF